MPTEREVQHPDGRVERITETSAAPTTVVERRGSGMGAVVALIIGLLAIVVIGGLVSSTLLTLILVPVLYDLLARFTKPRGVFERLIGRELGRPPGRTV